MTSCCLPSGIGSRTPGTRVAPPGSMSKTTSLALMFAFTTLASACQEEEPVEPPPPESPYQAIFSTASDAHRQRAVSAALGLDEVVATYLADNLPSRNCPVMEAGDDGRVLRGGCAMTDGTRVEGSVDFA